ncbi:MAG: PP2C family protein-serine/threonine phosphatase [Anaerolineae bacterium]
MNEPTTHSDPDTLAADESDEMTPEAAVGDPAQEDAPTVDEEADTETDQSGTAGDDQDEMPATIISRIPGAAAKKAPEHDPMIRVAQRTHFGAVRDRNEDSYLVFQTDSGGHFKLMPFGLYIVADGMGGHANGHVASKLASRVAARHIIREIYFPLLQDAHGANQKPVQEVLVDAVTAANKAVFEVDPEADSGTTLTVALLLGRRLHVAHVGDSRIYLFKEGKLKVISSDHSLAQRLQDVGHLTSEEATFFPYRHVLLRAVGQSEEVEVDFYMQPLPESGKLLLCSDGLCGMLPDSLLQTVLAEEMPVEETVDVLIEAALMAGGYDNITAIVVEFDL